MYISAKRKLISDLSKDNQREMLRKLPKTRCMPVCPVFIASSYSPKCYAMRFLIPFVRTKPKRSFQRDRNSSRAGSGTAEFEGDVISYEISGNREGYGLRALADFTQNTKQLFRRNFGGNCRSYTRRFVVKIKN